MKDHALEGFAQEISGRDPWDLLKEYTLRNAGTPTLILRPLSVSLDKRKQWVQFQIGDVSDTGRTLVGELLNSGWTLVDGATEKILEGLIGIDYGRRRTGDKGLLKFIEAHGPLWLDFQGSYSPLCFFDNSVNDRERLWVLREQKEPTAQYKRWSRITGAFCVIAAHLQMGEPAPTKDMEDLFSAYHENLERHGIVLPGGSPFISRKGGSHQGNLEGSLFDFAASTWDHGLGTLIEQKEVLFLLIEQELDRDKATPRVILAKNSKGEPVFTLIPGLGFLGRVLFDLGAILCGGKHISVCRHCGVPYQRKRIPKTGYDSWCPSCRPKRKEIKAREEHCTARRGSAFRK